MGKVLRPYQLEASDAAVEFLTKRQGKPLIVAPVGAGKSLLMAELMRRAVELYAPMRFLSLAHTSELLTQNAAELALHAPHIGFSFYADKLKQKNLTGQCIFASIQSIYRQAWRVPKIDVAIIDEAHLTGKKDTKMYRGLLDVLWQGNPDMRLIGYTGTPFNLKGGWLHEGDDALFDEIAYSISMTDLLADGYLCPLETPQMSTRIDTTGIRTVAGDFALSELEAASDRPEIIEECVREIITHGQDRKKWLVFAVSVSHAEHIRDEIRRYGISCEAVTGKTPAADRRAHLQRFEHGDLRCVVNVMALTTGFNNPKIDLLALMRPTRSRVLYVQAVGRGMRVHPDKRTCLVLDMGGIIEALGPVDKITVKQARSSLPQDAPMKSCPSCHAFAYASARECIKCGHVYPVAEGEVNLNDTASSAAVLSTQKVEPLRIPFDSVTYKRHEKVGSLPTMLVEYRYGMKRYREWVAFQHTGRARAKAMQWWMRRTNGSPAPLSTDEALARVGELAKPVAIGVLKQGDFFEIVEHYFEDELEVAV
ncbi:MAG TPA: DNA helicase [Verrucomicrobiales bacterium]|nr:DNA helicase [Verrucomicrobiales bacterium]